MPRKLSYIPIAIFSFIMLYVLAISSYLLKYFPLRSAGDMGIHIANIFFLDSYGFHGIVQNWYNGFKLFELYSPGFSYLGLIIQELTNNYLLTIYIALIVIYLIGFIGIYFICKYQGINKRNMLLFFLAFFFNYILAVYAIRTGRFPELLAWSFFTLFFFAVICYKDTILNKNAIFIAILYALLMLTHVYVFVVASILMVSLLMVKKNKERLMLVFLALLALAATSFWLVPFFHASQNVTDGAAEYGAGTELIDLSTIISTNTAIGLLFIIVFVFYARENKKDIPFYTPILILDLLLLSRLIYFIPIFRSVPTTPYNVFFAFVSLFLLFKIANAKVQKIAIIGLAIFAIFSAAYTLNIDVDYKHTELDREFFDIFAKIEGKYFILDKGPDVYHEKMASYAAAYYNLSTPIGYFREYERLKYAAENNSKALLKYELDEIRGQFNKEDCQFIAGLNMLGVNEIIVQKSRCDLAKKCGLKEKYLTKSLCLLKVPHN